MARTALRNLAGRLGMILKKMSILSAAAVVIHLLFPVASSAFAQGRGEADPTQAKAPPMARTTAAERRAARDLRKKNGERAARGAQMGEGQSEPVVRPFVPLNERMDASHRRAEANRAANQAGAFPRGGSGDAPEKQKR